MNKEETKQILTVLRINYPHSFKNLTNEETFQFLDLWSEAFKNDDASLVATAVKSIIYSDTREFAPNIGQVKAKMFELSGITQMDVGEAWQKVMRNISCNPQYARENYEKLPANIQKALGSYGVLKEIGYMDDTAVSFARRDFEKRFAQVLEEEKTNLISGLIDANQVQLNNTLPKPKEQFIGLKGINLIGNKMED
jgi:hypothetical protein